MLYAIVKRACLFLEDEYAENPVTHEMTQIILNQITVYPIQGDPPQELPDWCAYDELYDIGIKEGWIVQTTEQSAMAAKEQAKKKAAAGSQEKVPVGLQSGWTKK